ncbi:MAG: hypothetical protein AB4911_21265, partial [Oscillochloridaceae bacterium umkhey_bin13]
SRTNDPHVFTLSYEEASETTERILTLDEKKNKLGFANVTYFAAVDTDQLPSQTRLGRLNRLKSFPMGERRKAELILEHVATTIGDQVGSRAEPAYALTLDDLLLAYSVLRPGSRALILNLIERNEAFVADPATPGLYTYTPPVGGDDEDEDDEDGDAAEEPTTGMQPTRRRYGGRYADDDE